MKLIAPKGAASCSVDGQEYPVDAEGTVEVPDEHAPLLFSHGYAVPGSEVQAEEDTVAQLIAKLEEATAALEQANADFRAQAEKLAQVSAELELAKQQITELTGKLDAATARIAELAPKAKR